MNCFTHGRSSVGGSGDFSSLESAVLLCRVEHHAPLLWNHSFSENRIALTFCPCGMPVSSGTSTRQSAFPREEIPCEPGRGIGFASHFSPSRRRFARM